MNNSFASNPARTTTARRNSLKSLLTLASGAASLGVLTPAAEAAIEYHSFGAGQTVGYGTGQPDISWSLPGGASITLNRDANTAASHRIVAVIAGPGNLNLFGRQGDARSAPSPYPGVNVALRTNAGKTWNNAAGRIGGGAFGNIIRSSGGLSGGLYGGLYGPGAFSTERYLLFQFTDSSRGNQTEYGWVGMSRATYDANDKTKMSVTFTGWAYDDTGAMIGAGMGEVPEASNVVAGALVSALVVGHTGVRLWRKHKPAIVSQPA